MSEIDRSAAAGGVAETHISWVFFTPDRAFKLFKPVAFPFLDLSTPARRIQAADLELEQNRRFAPDVYLGTADVQHGDAVVDRMIVMRRLPDSRRLASLVDHADFAECVRAVARTVAVFHESAAPIHDAPMATRDAVRSNWADNLDAIEPYVDSVIDRGEYERVAMLAHRYLDGRDTVFESRIENGYVRDGHGDLTADDIFCLPDGPRILDCLAFSDDLRIGDVLLDIAFLVMDIHRLAGRQAAVSLMNWYREYSNTHHPASLAHHYVGYRAHVRAKVAALRFAQGDRSADHLARTYHRLALHHLEHARVRLVLVGGGPGAGKSTLASGLCDHFGYVHLATDEIRRDVTGTPRDEHRIVEPDADIYRPEVVDATYAEQRREAELLLSAGQSVVLDASWTSAEQRAAARELAERCAADMIEIECVLDPALARERIARRLSNPWNPSDATPELVDHMASRRDPWPSATPISTDAEHDVVLAEGIRCLSEHPIE